MTNKQGRTAGYRLSRRGLLYRDETGRERLAAVYWLTKLGTKTRWMLGLGVVGFIGLSILVAALDSTEDPLAGLTPEQVVSVQATATQEALTAQEEEARQEEIATQEALTAQEEEARQEEIASQEEKERAYLEALEEAAARQTAEAPKPTPEPTAGWSVQAVPGAVAEADDARVTINQIVDPWFTNNQFYQLAAGKRYVAFDVTVQHTAESGQLYVSSSKFRLLNAEDFAYDTAGFCPRPCLGSIDLGGGQKTRGWLIFEVDEGTPLEVLKYDPQPFDTDDIEFYFR